MTADAPYTWEWATAAHRVAAGNAVAGADADRACPVALAARAVLVERTMATVAHTVPVGGLMKGSHPRPAPLAAQAVLVESTSATVAHTVPMGGLVKGSHPRPAALAAREVVVARSTVAEAQVAMGGLEVKGSRASGGGGGMFKRTCRTGRSAHQTPG